MSRESTIAGVAASILVVGSVAWWATRTPRHLPPTASSAIAVPSIQETLELNGELEEESWRDSGRTGAFVAPGSTEAARPYSDARFLHDAKNLYVGLYAADQDEKRGVDAFLLAFIDPRDDSTLTLSVSIDKVVKEKRVRGGVASEWASGIQLGVDADGTLDDPSDEDEEWIVEAAIPLASLGITAQTRELRASIARCDTPKDSPERCGAWGAAPDGGIVGRLVLAGL